MGFQVPKDLLRAFNGGPDVLIEDAAAEEAEEMAQQIAQEQCVFLCC